MFYWELNEKYICQIGAWHLASWVFFFFWICITNIFVIKMVICEKARLDPIFSLQQLAQYLLSFVQDFWRGMPSSSCYCHIDNSVFTEYWRWHSPVEKQKEVGAASPTLSGAESLELVRQDWELHIQIRPRASSQPSSRETEGLGAGPSYLAFNQFNVQYPSPPV